MIAITTEIDQLIDPRHSRLYLVDISNGKKQFLLTNALFVQWVIQSDVVIAQTDTNLAIWYNIDMPEHITLMPVRGEVTEIVRENVSIPLNASMM